MVDSMVDYVVDYVVDSDGVVYVDPAYIKGRKGKGRKGLYPPCQGPPATTAATAAATSSLQERLLHKLGGTAYAFSFSMPQNLPCSVTMQPAPCDKGKSCGVDFEVKAFCCEKLDEDIKKKHSVSLLIRKVQFAPEKPGVIPSGVANVDSEVTMNASLDKEVYYHGQPITDVIQTAQQARSQTYPKLVKKILHHFDQISDVVLYCQDKYTKVVCSLEPADVVGPKSSLSQVYSLTPLLANNREKHGIALDGKLKHEDTNLASTTL
ncbi:unnamed protein product [Lampetra fluviatilis]